MRIPPRLNFKDDFSKLRQTKPYNYDEPDRMELAVIKLAKKELVRLSKRVRECDALSDIEVK